MIKLSIIVPVYKAEKYLKKCIDSILNQNSEEMELILVDDGSPDNCPQICDDYASLDKRVKVLHQANQGVVAARDNGIRIAKGNHLGFVDSDDFIKSIMITKSIEAINGNPDIDIIIYDYNTFSDDEEHNLRVHHQSIDLNWTADRIRDEFLLDHYPNYLCNKVFKKSLFAGFKIPDRLRMEDLYACARLFASAKVIKFVPDATYCYRLHASTFSNESKTKKKYGMFIAWREHERVCEEGGFASLEYSRMRTSRAAISLKIINYAEGLLNEEQIDELNNYLKTIENNTSKKSLSFKYRFELWADKHFPACLLKWLGLMSVYAEKRKQRT